MSPTTEATSAPTDRSLPDTRRPRILVLMNDAAGGGRAGGLDGEIALLGDERALDLTIRRVPGPNLTTEAAAAATSGAWDILVAAGGDGTVGAVAGAVAGTEVALGVLPLGTLNHFAKDLGLPLDLAGAIGVLAAANRRSVDVAEVNGRCFVNNSALGLYPALVVDRDQQRRHRRRNKWIAYGVAALRMAFRFPLLRIGVRCHGMADGLSAIETPLIFIGNNKYRMNLLAFGSRTKLTGGLLSVYLIKRRSRLGMLGLLAAGLVGRLNQARDFESYQVDTVEIAARRGRMRVSLDGEVHIMRPPLTYRSRPGALTVVVPSLPPS
ncbi:MAG TPA: diacylglycerol kinase family protein [Stellaceae bacterium]|nr:diacylglycerol kinase family protein [Stellaceae bacterium]